MTSPVKSLLNLIKFAIISYNFIIKQINCCVVVLETNKLLYSCFSMTLVFVYAGKSFSVLDV